MVLRGECYGRGAAAPLLEVESELRALQEPHGSQLGQLEVGEEQGVVVCQQGP